MPFPKKWLQEKVDMFNIQEKDFIETIWGNNIVISVKKEIEFNIDRLKSLKKKYKSKGFAAGCSREVIERGAQQLGWDLEKLLTMTLEAMKATEDEIRVEMEREEK